ncbi:hypothetical protein RJT34_11214 [Clitoria ternatea]|uniref:Uncharacterized protein n=1 Tax=Clitoria ternatea TaxID=43366 RepID=A0AAN9JJI1_CLITE
MSTPAVERVSECFVTPESPTQESNQICHLALWDIAMLSVNYIQKGMLFKKPTPLVDPQHFIQNPLNNLKHSLSLAPQTQDPPSYVVFVDCKNSPGAKFIYATLNMTISDILSPIDVPPIVQSYIYRL